MALGRIPLWNPMGLSWERWAGDMPVPMREVQVRLGVRVPMALSLSQSCAGIGLKHSHSATGHKSDPVLPQGPEEFRVNK